MRLQTYNLFCLASLLGVSSTAVTPASFSQREFDYVVVGGGTAGLTLAVRLSEDPAVTVGVIEAGLFLPNEDLINVPFDEGQSLGNDTLDWKFVTTPQPNVNNRIMIQPRGKVLGGSSALNYMVYHRASEQDYDAWQTLGNTGWGWNSLLPYFKKAETVTPGPEGIFPGTTGAPGSDPQFEGKSGPLKIGFNRFYSDLIAPYVNAVRSLGGNTRSDPDSGNATGTFNAPRSVDDKGGVRSYSATAYYAPNAHRTNLVVLLDSQATRVDLSRPAKSTHYTATGVNFTSGGKEFFVKARKEVIVSAGAVKTPQLLELSGIGNKTILSKLGISTLIDLPGVGENFQDHLLFASDFILKKPSPLTWDAIRNNATFAQQQALQYSTNHTGIFASTISAFSFYSLQTFGIDSVADTGAGSNESPLTQAQYAIQKQWLKEGQVGQLELVMVPGGGSAATNVPILANESYITITAALVHPFSRGSVHINTTNGLAPPVVNPNYFSHPFDVKTLVEGAKLVRKISETAPLAALIDRPSTPPPNITSDADLTNFVKTFVDTVFHPAGSAPMAPEELGGVVDNKLTVYGTHNLRIVDASIFPMHIAAHPQASVYAISEMAADIIKHGD